MPFGLSRLRVCQLFALLMALKVLPKAHLVPASRDEKFGLFTTFRDAAELCVEASVSLTTRLFERRQYKSAGRLESSSNRILSPNLSHPKQKLWRGRLAPLLARNSLKLRQWNRVSSESFFLISGMQVGVRHIGVQLISRIVERAIYFTSLLRISQERVGRNM